MKKLTAILITFILLLGLIGASTYTRAVMDALMVMVHGIYENGSDALVFYDDSEDELAAASTMDLTISGGGAGSAVILDDNEKFKAGGVVADYYSSSSIGNLTSPSGKIEYKRIGDQVCVVFFIQGTSSSGNDPTFTLPKPNIPGSQTAVIIPFRATDGDGSAISECTIASDSSTVTCYRTAAGTANGWKTSGTLYVQGNFCYFTDASQ